MATSTTGNGWPGKYADIPWESVMGMPGCPVVYLTKWLGQLSTQLTHSPSTSTYQQPTCREKCVGQVAKEKEESKPMEPVRRAKRIDMINIYLQVVGRYYWNPREIGNNRKKVSIFLLGKPNQKTAMHWTIVRLNIGKIKYVRYDRLVYWYYDFTLTIWM